jgi:hypothetical protein
VGLEKSTMDGELAVRRRKEQTPVKQSEQEKQQSAETNLSAEERAANFRARFAASEPEPDPLWERMFASAYKEWQAEHPDIAADISLTIEPRVLRNWFYDMMDRWEQEVIGLP